MKRTLVAALCVIAVAVACTPAGPQHDTAADLAALGKVRDAYMAAFKAGDAAAIGALYTADAHIMNNAQPTAIGSQAIAAALKPVMDQMAGHDIVLTPDKTDVSGDVAYETGSYKTTMTPKGAAAMVEEGRYLVVLRRQADGSWKLADDMGNLPTGPAPMPAATKAPQKAPPKK